MMLAMNACMFSAQSVDAYDAFSLIRMSDYDLNSTASPRILFLDYIHVPTNAEPHLMTL